LIDKIDTGRLRVATWLAREGLPSTLFEIVDSLALEADDFDKLTLLAGLVLVPAAPEGPGEGDAGAIEALIRQALYDGLMRLDAALALSLPALRYPQPAGPELTKLATRLGLQGGLYTGWPLD
jgi:hypothetical protein